MTIEQRRAILDETYNAVLVANSGQYTLTAGAEAESMWDSAMRSFEHGTWAAAIMCPHALCERTLASLLESWYALPPEPKGWRMWGRGRLIEHRREHDLVTSALLDQTQYVCDARKPFGHWRLPLAEGSLDSVGYEAHLQGGHWQDAQEAYAAEAAVLCTQTAIRVYFGDLWMRMPSRTWTKAAEEVHAKANRPTTSDPRS